MLIRHATVLTQDPELGDLPSADVRVTGALIDAVGPDLGEARPGEEVLDAAGAILIPGFVDTHRHMWEGALRGAGARETMATYFDRVLGGIAPALTPDELAASEAWSARASLAAGITTVQDTSDIHDSPARAEAIVGALRDSGLRVVFGYGLSRAHLLRHGGALPPSTLRRLRDELDGDGLVTLALTTLPGDDDAERSNAALAAELAVRTVHHVRPEIRPSRLRDLGALRPGTTFVHGNHLEPDELRIMADAGGSLSVSPVIEAAMALGHPMVAEAGAVGLPISLSVDVELVGPTDMFAQMRGAYLHARLHDPDSAPTPRDVLGWATLNGAWALGLADRTGSITPGKQADLVLLRVDGPEVSPVIDPYATVVLQADRAHVDTVLVAGVAHRRGGRATRDDDRAAALARAVPARLRADGLLPA